jgi:hypothetical protein
VRSSHVYEEQDAKSKNKGKKKESKERIRGKLTEKGDS